MFDFVGKHKRIVQIILALITLPFAFFGVDYYFRGGAGGGEVATVSGDPVSPAEFNAALTEQQDRMRQQLGAAFDPALIDNPEARFQILEGVINRRLLQNAARKESFRISDGQLQQFIASIPAFQENGQFSSARYQQLLAAQNLTPLGFEERLRQDLLLAPLSEPISGGNLVASGSGQRFLNLLEQKREVAMAAVELEQFLPGVKIDEPAIKAFYDANPKSFQSPELARFEYVLLTQDALSAAVTSDAAEIRAQYDNNLKTYSRGEEREAAHILIAVKPDAKPEDKAAAKKKADDVLAQVKANPGKFAELAKQYSQDPGSAAQGGSLGSFGKGTMVKPFEDAVFAMKVNDITGPVESDFGYHVIRLNAISPAQVRPFDQVKGQIEVDLKRQKAAQKFASAAEQFQNLVYEQADSLQGAAKALGLTVQTTPLVTRQQAQQIAQGSAKFVQALYSPESLQSKRNTEAIEVGPNALMSGRIVEYKPAALRPFAEVAEEIRKQLTRQAASEMAVKAGREKLALLEQGKSDKEVGLTFGAPVTLARNQVQPGFPPEALSLIFQADPTKVPEYTGTTNERGGFAIFRIVKVIEPAPADASKLAAARRQIGDQLGRELFNAYIAGLRAKSEVKINQANLEKK